MKIQGGHGPPGFSFFGYFSASSIVVLLKKSLRYSSIFFVRSCVQRRRHKGDWEGKRSPHSSQMSFF